MRIYPGDKVMLAENPSRPSDPPCFIGSMLKGVVVTVKDAFERTNASNETEIWFHIDEEVCIYSERWVDCNLTEDEENILPDIHLSFDELF